MHGKIANVINYCLPRAKYYIYRDYLRKSKFIFISIYEYLINIIFMPVIDHCDNILVYFQHGIRWKKKKKRSEETQLILTVTDLGKNLDENKQMDMLIFDFTKAFDTVPHKRLITKLEYYGIRGDIHKWIENWLTSRVHR